MTLRCPACRTRRASFTSMLKHIRESGHKLCDCGAYHYKHRPFGGYCHQHEMSAARNAARFGAIGDDELAELIVEITVTTPGRAGKRCPF